MRTFIIIIVSMVMAISGVNAEMISNGDGTITDTVTDLTWESRSGYLNYDDSCDYCDSLVAGGYDDWRMPTVEELITTIDYNTGVIAHSYVFPNNFTNLWSTTSVYRGRNRTINKTGSISWADTYERQWVKCVRGDFKKPVPVYVEWSNETETTYTLNNARYYCANLVESGRDDWRLPTIEELIGVIDFDSLVAYANSVWSGTLAGPSEHAWKVSFMDGSVIPNRLIAAANVRCVCEEEVIDIGLEDIATEDVEMKKYFVDENGLALDGTGSIHAYPNTLNHHSLRYARHLNKKAGIKAKNIAVPIVISGYVVDKLATFVYGEGVVEAYFLFNEKRFDIEPDFEGNFEGVVDLVGPHKIKDWVGLSWEVELHAVDPEGTDSVVDVTNITVENFKDKPWKQKKVKKQNKCKKQKQNKGKGCNK